MRGGVWGSLRRAKWLRYVLDKPNPVVQIIYLILVLGGYGLFLISGFTQLPSAYLGEWHKYSSFLVIIVALHSFMQASVHHPGVLIDKTMPYFDAYNYDGVLYQEKQCSTCHIRKIARSKHCSVCNQCIPRFDHHCIWLNTCIGEQNHWLFLRFLMANLLLCGYGTFVLFCLLYEEYLNLLHDDFLDATTQAIVKGDTYVVVLYMMHEEKLNVILFLTCSFMGMALGTFFLFHVYLVSTNTTSNEFFKRRRLSSSDRAKLTPWPYTLSSWKTNWNEVISPRFHTALQRAKKAI